MSELRSRSYNQSTSSSTDSSNGSSLTSRSSSSADIVSSELGWYCPCHGAHTDSSEEVYRSLKLPRPNEVVRYDFRPTVAQTTLESLSSNASSSSHSHLSSSQFCSPPVVFTGSAAQRVPAIRVAQWNIERGYKLDGIISELKALDADLICLQEIDIHCARSGFRDIGREIAAALQLNYVFLCEFEELHGGIQAKLRDPQSEGGGVHGNGILTKFDIAHVTVVEHPHQPVNWNVDGTAKREPRRGVRNTLKVQINTPIGMLSTYTAHFEVFCGLSDRVIIFTQLFNDIRKDFQIDPALIPIICGDFNTLAHSIARLSKKYCLDSMRWRSLGWTESEWIARYILNVWDDDLHNVHPTPNNRLRTYFSQSFISSTKTFDSYEQFLCSAKNPHLFDPFDVYSDVTLHNYSGWYKGKLDWILLNERLKVLEKKIGNHQYNASDHKWLMVRICREMQFDGESLSERKARRKKKLHHTINRPSPGILTCSNHPVFIYSLYAFYVLICVWLVSRVAYTRDF